MFKAGQSGNPATQFSSTNQPTKRGRRKNFLTAMRRKDGEISLNDEFTWWNHCRILPMDELKELTKDTTQLEGWMLDIARMQYKSASGDLKAFNALRDRFYGKPKQTIEQQQTMNVKVDKPRIIFKDTDEEDE